MDFSLTGVRLSLAHALKPDAALSLRLWPPAADIQVYQQQKPIEIAARIAWQRVENGKPMAGLAFINVTDAQRNRLRECFDYFSKSAEYVR